MLANLQSLEGTVDTETTLTLNRKSRKIIITNDHASGELSFKFNASEAFGTLKGTETISLEFNTPIIIIKGTDIPYRIWVFG